MRIVGNHRYVTRSTITVLCRRIAFIFAVVGSCIISASGQAKTFDGFTFVFSGKNAKLYDINKKVINEWTCQNTIQCCADFLRDSSIIVSAAVSGCAWSEKNLAVPYSRLQIINWKGEITWDYQYCSADYIPHHDIEPVYRTNDPKEKPTFLIPCYTAWGDKIVEIRPTGAKTGEVIWEWAASNHVCTSGCADKPEVLDKSKGGSGTFNKTSDAMHVNGVSFNRRLDQIIVSVKGYNEFIVLDHSTTTAEAKGTTGGKYGKGGSILYRWGKSANYGVTSGSTLNSQHHCCWIPDTMPGTSLPIPGGGNFMAVNNNDGKNGSFMEVANPDLKNGAYPRAPGAAFEPAAPLWKYAVADLNANEGSIQKLPNGNYLVCTGGVDMSGMMGGAGAGKRTFGGTSKKTKVMEVAPSGSSEGTVVWELTDIGYSAEAYRYAYGYIGKGALENAGSAAGARRTMAGKVFYDPHSGIVKVPAGIIKRITDLAVYSLNGGVVIRSSAAVRPGEWSLGRLSAGVYIVKLQSDEELIVDRFLIE